MGGHHGFDDGVCWSYFHGRWTDDTWPAYIAHFDRLFAVNPGRLSLLTITSETDTPSAAQRAELARWMKAHAELMNLVRASAMVMDSAVARGALTALNWVVSKPWTERVFARTIDGVQWLGQEDPSVVPHALLATLRLRIPDDELVLP